MNDALWKRLFLLIFTFFIPGYSNAVKKTILSEPFKVVSYDEKWSDSQIQHSVANGRTEINVYSDDYSGEVTEIEKRKQSVFEFYIKEHGRQIRIKSSVEQRVSLTKGGGLKLAFHLENFRLRDQAKAGKQCFVKPTAQRIIKKGMVEHQDLLCADQLRVALTVNALSNERRLSVQVDDEDPEDAQVEFFETDDELTHYQHAILGVPIINAIRILNPESEDVIGINFLLSLSKVSDHWSMQDFNSWVSRCARKYQCDTQPQIYKEVTFVGFKTGYYICGKHNNYSLGYYPFYMRLLKFNHLLNFKCKLIQHPKYVFHFLINNTPMIEEITQGRAFLFLKEVLSSNGVRRFLRENGFWVLEADEPPATPLTHQEVKQPVLASKLKTSAYSFEEFERFLPFSDSPEAPGQPPISIGVGTTGALHPERDDESFSGSTGGNGKNGSHDESKPSTWFQ